MRILISGLFFLSLVPSFILVISGCGRESGCNVFGSENYDPEAVVDDGSCIEMRDKFLGQYSVTSDCMAGAYIRSINETGDRFVVEITAMGDTLGTVLGVVAGPDITIDRQTVRTNVTVEGAGVYDTAAHVLDLSIRIRDSRSGGLVITNCLDRCVKN